MNAVSPSTSQVNLSPECPSSRDEIIVALRRIATLQGLADEEYAWLADNGAERFVPAGEILFREGQTATAMVILLRGEVHVRRDRAGVLPLFIGRSGQITGLIPYSRMKTYGGIGFAVGDVWALDVDHSRFDDMLKAIPSMAQRCVSTLLDRVREVTRIEQQTEKLSALGKLAGNLAHELNNPASAAQRSASGLLEELRRYGHHKYEMGALCLQPADLEAVRLWQKEMSARRGSADSAENARREDTLTAWFQSKGFGDSCWELTPELSEQGVCVEDLDRLQISLQGENLLIVLRQFVSSLRAEKMTEAMVDATDRIFDLIRAVKDYSYMDQAPIQEIDIPQSFENTLAMLQSRLNNIEVERRYAADLPRISAYGSELNQVWMALLENALDSIQECPDRPGRITVGATISGGLILVEVWDNGHGIPTEIRDRIFEPFFSTRAPGKGLGLGLDTAQRIVRKHRGYIRVQSTPEATCFQVRLPIEQLQAY